MEANRTLNPGRWLWCAVGVISVSASAQSLPQSTLVKQYCVGCHNQKLTTAGVSFEGLDLAKVGDRADIWERALRKVRSGQMPPPGLPHPAPPASAAFVNWLEDSLDRAAAAKPNPGRPAVHRLNRAEYSNAIRDLLAVDVKPGSMLPIDDSGYGFDNIGDVLSISPVLLERYISAARLVSRLAVGDPTIKPAEEEYVPRRDPPGSNARPRSERVSDDLPFDSRGGMAFRHYFPVDAEYTLRVKLNNNAGGNQRPLEMRLPVKAGLRTVG